MVFESLPFVWLWSVCVCTLWLGEALVCDGIVKWRNCKFLHLNALKDKAMGFWRSAVEWHRSNLPLSHWLLLTVADFDRFSCRDVLLTVILGVHLRSKGKYVRGRPSTFQCVLTGCT